MKIIYRPQQVGEEKAHLHDAIPVPEAVVAGLTVGELAGEASGTLVAADARHPLLANAVSCYPVALGGLDAAPVAVTSCRKERETAGSTLVWMRRIGMYHIYNRHWV